MVTSSATVKHAHRFIFGYLTLILLIAAVGGMYSWQHKKVNDSNAKIANLEQKVSSLQSQVNKLSKQTSATSSTSSASYLKITQLNIEIPLTSSLSDLSYTWDSSNSQAILGSSTLMNAFVKEDPADCSKDASSPYPISYVSTNPNLESINGTPGYIKQVTVKGTAYYWYLPRAGNGCDFSPSTSLNSQVTNYYNEALAQFNSAAAT
jgi:outer membrane murein-binding lipoprotein Lpp